MLKCVQDPDPKQVQIRFLQRDPKFAVIHNICVTSGHYARITCLSAEHKRVGYTFSVSYDRWKAEYRLIPDEQDVIEATLKQLVRF